jgi:hypothetical protein
MTKLRRFLGGLGWIGFIRLGFYPLTALVITPVRLVQTLWACRILADGRWGDYSHFSAYAGISYLFYWTRALNLYRFGRAGLSPYLALGNYRLSRCFYYSLPSLYAQWVAGPVVPLAGILGWWLLHLVWMEQVSPLWVLAVMGLALISTTLYANAFMLQNYNALGWLFFSTGLYGMATSQWVIAGLAWFASSFGSFTVAFLAGILSLVFAADSWSVAPLLAVLPTGLKLLTHFWPFLIHGHTKETLLGIMKAIGITRKGGKYKRNEFQKLGIGQIYYLLLYGQFVLVTYLLKDDLPILLLTGVILFLLNSTFMRFADVQSIQMLMISLATVVTIQSVEPLLLPSYWLLMSPLPRLAGVPAGGWVLDVVPKCAPFPIKRLVEGMEQFLQPVQRGQRVLMAFDNPNGVYEKVFDGYRTLLELPLYVATRREIHFMPDWWGVFELNYEGAPEFWGRDVDSVLQNVEYWHADYVVIYQEAGTALELKWQEAGFEVAGKFSWADYANDLRGEKPYTGPTPDWWLLRKPREIVTQ